MFYTTTDQTQLHVETSGEGPVLILVPGANGTGNIFGGVAKALQSQYQVVMFDRRGYGDTKLARDIPAEAADFDNRYRLLTDARDVIELADHFSPTEPVYLFGSSSGSIVAAEAYSEAPERFKKVVIHECPISTVTPDRDQLIANNTDSVTTALKGDFAGARDKFGRYLRIQPLDAKMMGLSADSPKPDPARLAGMMYWFKYEILQYTGATIDWSALAADPAKVALLNGTDSIGDLPQDINQALSKQLNVPITMIPGGHLGYAQKPAEFATGLAAVLN